MRAQIVLALVLLKAESESRVQVKALGGSRRSRRGKRSQQGVRSTMKITLWATGAHPPSTLDKYMEVSQHCLREGQEAAGDLHWHCFPVAVGNPRHVNPILLGCICIRSKQAI